MATIDRQSATLALAHALAAAERGLPVIPLSATKLPALRSPHHGEDPPIHCRGACGRPGHGVHDATTDPAAVRALFAAAPRATGYGIACGRPPHRLIGIDLDFDTARGKDSMAALQQLAERHRFTIPPTITVLTPSGGRHLWLTGPPDVAVPNSASRLAPGIDIRGFGGYLVGPGSVTAHGTYRLAPGTAHLTPAPCPRTLLHLLTPPTRLRRPRRPTDHRPASHQGAGGRGQGLIQFVRSAREGQRNTSLFWAACRAYEHGFGDDLADGLTAAAVHTGLSEQEARAAIASAARLTTGHPGHP
ncbi:DNA primase [Streptomyces finlayi]|uniref:DNA primase n=1 Tax=Streptomyces finlayi TaxID=67296 RepID=A0A7G7BLA6_9ACTN|nr:bifunctional DNA primase/polymerase [Streptomyces finlayi]QNE76121.1 DNA primase [Streptomyces finlayi]